MIPPDVRIFVCTEPVDMRRGVDGTAPCSDSRDAALSPCRSTAASSRRCSRASRGHCGAGRSTGSHIKYLICIDIYPFDV